jgi:outer membrane protein OmpA-like peptidoglycan-associated protein
MSAKKTTTNLLRLGITHGSLGLFLLAHATHVLAEEQQKSPDAENKDNKDNQDNQNQKNPVISPVNNRQAPDLSINNKSINNVAEPAAKVPVVNTKIENAQIPTVDLPGINLEKPGTIPTLSPNPNIPAALEKKSAPEEIKNISQVGNNTPNGNNTVKLDNITQTVPDQSKTQIRILTPQTNAVFNQPAATVILEITGKNLETSNTEVELKVNGVSIDSSSIGRSEVSTDSITQTWYGVILSEGENTITAQIKGTNIENSVKVQLAGSPTQLKIKTQESRIPADKRSTATVIGELLDKNGNRSNRKAVVTLTTTDGEFIGADYDKDAPGFQVLAENGIFTATLRSGLQAKQVYIKANNLTLNIEAFTTIQFETDLRNSLVTGVFDIRLGARGTDYYRSFREFLPVDKNNKTQLQTSGAIFATGTIFDNWLFTGAYNSERTLNQNCNGNGRLYGNTQSCDNTYSVYGDSSTSSKIAPSQDSLYIRLEQSANIPGADPNYFMWGDYNTNELAGSAQQFTAITRQLHGFKANYNLGNLQVTGLYANNLQGFQRDTIGPDGTSGYYFLSRRLLVEGSENISLEVEELNKPGIVIKQTKLTRGQDYDIDYDRGSIIFKEPILRTDIDEKGQVLVRRIVATYQFEEQTSDNNLYAGRIKYNFNRNAGSETFLGGTYLKEKKGIREFELYGLDGLISLGKDTKIIAEYAHSTNDSQFVGTVGGSAYRVEFNSQFIKDLQTRAYFQSTDAGFANNATTSFVPGQTRYGADFNYKLGQNTNLKFQYSQENNFGVAPRPLDVFSELITPKTDAIPGSQVDNSATTISAGLQQRFGSANLDLDWIHTDRTDRLPTSPLSSSSDQLRSRLTFPINNKINFYIQNETTLSGTDTVGSDRTGVGLNWNVFQGVTLQLGQQWFHTGPMAGKALTNISVLGDYKLGTDTSITGRYSVLGGANSTTTQGAIGLNQKWAITPGLKLSFAYEHLFGGSSFVNTANGLQFAQPYSSGQSASSIGVAGGDSYSIGLEYNDNPGFQSSLRYEKRSSSGGTNTNITAGLTGKITPALTGLFRYQQNNTANQNIVGLDDTVNVKLGLAFRDINNDKLNALLRYEYRKNPAVIPETLFIGRGTGSEDHTFGLEAIYTPSWQWEFYGKYALRNSTSYLAQDLVGSSTISLVQGRATYRLGYNFDLVGEARWINQHNTGYSETGFSTEVGYYLSPNLRFALGYSSGDINSSDIAGNRNASGVYAGLSVKVNELFDGFGLQRPIPKQQEEVKNKSNVTVSQKPKVNIPQVLNLDMVQTLKFVPEKSELNDKNLNILNNLSVVLQEYRALGVELLTYLPSLNKNDSIEYKRMEKIRSYLISKGITGGQVVIRSLGKPDEKAQTEPEVKMILHGSSDVFLAMATRVKNGGGSSPALDTLASIVNTPQVTDLVAKNPLAPSGDQTVASLPQSIQTSVQSPVKADASINFKVNGNIDSQNQKLLTEIADKLQKDTQATIEIQGYLLSANSSDLETERVMAVRSALMDSGVNENQIIIRELDNKVAQNNNQMGVNNKVDLILSNNNQANTTAQIPNNNTENVPVKEDNTAQIPNNQPVALNNANKTTENIKFNLDTNINAQAQQLLDKIATKLQNDPKSNIEIQGYLSGNKDATLEMDRLMAVRSYLMDKGVNTDQIIIKELDNSLRADNNNPAFKISQTSQVDLIISSSQEGTTTAQAKPTDINTVALKPASITTTNINFVRDKISLEDQTMLDKLALKIKFDQQAKVEIQGYLPVGSQAELEQQRVLAIQAYLLKQGLAANQIIIKPLDNNKLVFNQVDVIISSSQEGTTTAQAKPTDINTVALKPADITPTNIKFGIDEKINPDNEIILSQLALKLKTEPQTKVEIQGYLPIGPNVQLEQKRVSAIQDYLLKQGVANNQIIIKELDGNKFAFNQVDVIISSGQEGVNTAQAKPTDINTVALKPASITTTNINFVRDKISLEDQTMLDKLALKIKFDQQAKVEIQGYLPVGSQAELEQQRVLAIQAYLLKQGLAANQIIIKPLDNNKLVFNQVDVIISSSQEGINTAQAKPTEVNNMAFNPADMINKSQISQSIEFSLDSNITAQSKEVLDQVASVLQSNQAIAIELQGYLPSNNGSAEKENQRLLAVRQYLTDKGVKEAQISIRPLDNNQLQADVNTDQKISIVNKVDIILSMGENTNTALLSPDSDTQLLRFTSALNYLMGDEKSAKSSLFKAMGIKQPDAEGAMVLPEQIKPQK